MSSNEPVRNECEVIYEIELTNDQLPMLVAS